MMRTDIHRPASQSFDPEAYDCFGVFDNHELHGNLAERGQAIRSLVAQGYRFGAGSSNQCGHCGSGIRYAALMVHRDINEFIFVGETCLDNRFELTKTEFHNLRKQAKLNAERATRAEVAERTFAENPWLNEIVEHELADDFLASLHEQAREGKVLSERQIEAGQKALERAKVRQVKMRERQAADDALVASGVKVPQGKVTVQGEVKTVKWQENAYGGQLKMLVQSDEGWKVWTTVPRSLQGNSALINGEWFETEDVRAGERIEFTATVTPSNDDPLFGFGKRPTKARFLDRAATTGQKIEHDDDSDL